MSDVSGTEFGFCLAWLDPKSVTHVPIFVLNASFVAIRGAASFLPKSLEFESASLQAFRADTMVERFTARMHVEGFRFFCCRV